ncbi:helix-hairpin-helix domain-containing protein [Aquimarina sp. 2201CG1-2-11]|uniref:ComEA family DNA-binding protein n=1 Tax=Aquimarina discodermiae TaxID=3231043 RepID=UPI0034626D6B
MTKIKSHFELHTRFRNGIFLLSILLLGIVSSYYFYNNRQKPKNNFAELKRFQKEIDSLKTISQSKKKKQQHKLFNPNFISDYKGYLLGLSTEELDRLFAYRDNGKWINSVAEFKKVTRVSDSLLERISPLFKFPDWTKNTSKRTRNTVRNHENLPYAQKKDLNTTTVIELQEHVGVPDFIAERIIKYRNKIGGFVSDLQIEDIYGLYDNQKNKLLSLYTVKTPKEIKKINLNKAKVKELMNVPYFDFETAIEIVDFIKNNGQISSFDELEKIEGFSLEKIDRIALYLTLN